MSSIVKAIDLGTKGQRAKRSLVSVKTLARHTKNMFRCAHGPPPPMTSDNHLNFTDICRTAAYSESAEFLN